MNDKARTSPSVASTAGHVLSDPAASAEQKSLAGSALAQAPSHETTAGPDEAALEKRKAEDAAVGTQRLTLRARADTHHIGVVISKAGGGLLTQRLVSRHGIDVDLEPGDHLVAIPLEGRNRDEFEHAERNGKPIVG